MRTFRWSLWPVFTLFVISSCIAQSPAQSPAQPSAEETAASRALAILENSGNWESIFNGKDLQGWMGDTQGYAADDGLLICKKGGKNLVTEKTYSDFVFQFEFKLEESGNNGIGIRVPKSGHAATDGLEIQILDHNGARYASDTKLADGSTRKLSWLKPWQYHGSIYGITAAKTGSLKPVGQWNQETIIAIEDHIMVILNGSLIVDTYLNKTTPVDGKAHPGMKNTSGHLMLAGHSDRVEFRKLQIADFTKPPTTPQVTEDNQPPVGFSALFNGTDLSGWKGLAHKNAVSRRALTGKALTQAQSDADQSMHDHWSVIDGILTYDGKGQSLCTATDYGDFDLYLEWKIPPGADSGIYLRGTPQVQIWDPWDTRSKPAGSVPDTADKWVAAYNNGRNLGSGGLWNNRRWRNSPLTRADKQPGEWNQFLIRMVGDKVTIWLNDKLIVNRVELENYWDKSGINPLPRADQIELQHHGSELFFKNLFIRQLPY